MTATAAPPIVNELAGEFDALDRAVYSAIATSPTPALDPALRRLSRTADHGVLWLGVASVMALANKSSRRAAVAGLSSLVVASFTVNVVAKHLVPRARPDRAAANSPVGRHVLMPSTPSFPSGHSASAFAFASAVSSELPALSLPIDLLAAAVAYSRIHTGVHYPSDTIIGASIGLASAALTTRVITRVRSRR